jgi:hypothetical protein
MMLLAMFMLLIVAQTLLAEFLQVLQIHNQLVVSADKGLGAGTEDPAM